MLTRTYSSFVDVLDAIHRLLTPRSRNISRRRVPENMDVHRGLRVHVDGWRVGSGGLESNVVLDRNEYPGCLSKVVVPQKVGLW